MTKLEFMTELSQELKRRGLADCDEILEEYEEHFAFKVADGYSEEEIAAKLGAPKDLAAQFDPAPRKKTGAGRFFTVFGLCWLDLFYGIFVVLLLAWGVVMASMVLSFGLVGICLVGNLGVLPVVSLPEMPYVSALLLGISLLGLAAVCVVGCVYYFAFVRQFCKAYARFCKNALSASRGEPALPALPFYPQFSPARRRSLRTVLLVSLVCFGVFLVAGASLSAILAGNVQFWHVWHWFGYGL